MKKSLVYFKGFLLIFEDTKGWIPWHLAEDNLCVCMLVRADVASSLFCHTLVVLILGI